jgi:ankyrin repeat protein
MKFFERPGCTAAIGGAALLLVLPVLLAAQAAAGKQSEKSQVVDMISFRVAVPPGGKWNIDVLEEGVRVLFSKAKGGGLLGALSPAPQQRETIVVVSSIGLPAHRWLMDESGVVDTVVDDYVKAMNSNRGDSFDLLEKGETALKDKKLRFAKFKGQVRAMDDPGQYFTQDQLVYYYFPPDFRKTHRYFQFESIFSRVVSGLKLYQNPGSEPLLAVVDSLEIVSTLAPAPGLDGELIKAAEAGDLEGARRALDKGASPDAAFGRATALSVAAFFGRREVVELLLDRGAAIDAGDAEKGATPLFQAVMGLEPEMARLLVERGADVDKKTKPGMPVLSLAASSKQADVAAMLVEHGADVGAKDAEELTPLMYAAEAGSPEIVGLLLEHGAEINAKSNVGTTALMAAVEMGHAGIFETLLERGADINLKIANGWTALWSAVDNRRLEMARVLIDKGADVNAALTGEQATDTPTLLHLAIYRAQPDIARMLVEAGADVDAKNETGLTSLMRAAWSEQADAVKLLIDKGADVLAKGEKNRTALWYAKKVNNKEIARMLQAAGAK